MTTALYRRYRPETFQDVIGQSHVTDPLMTALRKNKVNHAYLFSGPRGCGKTTSARILARCLNCVEGPTPTPCGRCESCVDLSRDGAGSLDVIEMDAASHGGVDDARQLRERATFAPVRDRYKIFIIDEAHMVTRDGFNALLKIVEEPPEHIKFIFATTEPNKVLPTIRSRTHHYPFRLVPPEPLMEYLQQLSDQESVAVEPGVMAMVVRAGGGSVRDSLSVLDQLMAGTDTDSVTYNLAVSLLGYTHGALLDDVVDAFASGDAATVFRAVDRVIQTGQDPRRFVEDLLERFRDLVIVDAVPESAANILHGMPEDQVARLRNQAQLMGAAELSRAADITNEALTEMTGATSPQLHLELLCARLLLPSAENSTRGAGARIDRLERRLNMGRTGAPTGPLVGVEPAGAAGDRSTAAANSPAGSPQAHAPSARAADEPVVQPADSQTVEHSHESVPPLDEHRSSAPATAEPADSDAPEPQSPSESSPRPSAATREARSSQQPTPSPQSTPQNETPAPQADPATAQGPSSGGGIDMIRASWTEIVTTLAEIHRVSWMTVMRATPLAFDGSVLQVVFEAEGDRKNFPRFEPNLVAAIQQVLGVSCRVEAVGPGEGGSHRAPGGSSPTRDGSGTTGGESNPGAHPTNASGSGRRSRADTTGPDAASQSAHTAVSGNGPGARSHSHKPTGPEETATGQGSAQDRGATGTINPETDRSDLRRSGVDAERSAGSEPEQDSDPVDSWTVAKIPTGDEPADSPTLPETEDSPAQPSANGTDQPMTAEVSAEASGPLPQPAPGTAQTKTGSSTNTETPEPTSSTVNTENAQEGSGGHRGAASSWARPDSPTPPDSTQISSSPYDDIPWPDEPPPEDEPPVPDTFTQGRPSRASGGPGPQQRPASAGSSAPSAAGGTTAPKAANTHQASARSAASEDELPPEQWRPSSSPTNGNGTAPTSAPESSGAVPTSAPARKPSFRERHAAHIAAAQADSTAVVSPVAAGATTASDEDFVPSDDDVAVEHSGLQGRAMIEKILGGRLVEERPHQPLL